MEDRVLTQRIRCVYFSAYFSRGELIVPWIVRLITEDTATSMKKANGSAAWYGKKESFERAEYFVAVTKGERKPFFIAQIDKVVPVPESGEKRWSLQFSRYAELQANEHNYNRDDSSNPAIGMPLEQLLPNLAVEDIDWETAPKQTQKWSFSNRIEANELQRSKTRGLTIAEAKRGLSIGLGLSEDQIDIVIRA